MKTSLKKLQKFAALRHDKRAHKKHQFLAHDELARATQDMIDMRDCYDRLLSAAAATANSVYEFSESLSEMGDCLLEKTALSDDEESGKVLLMLGKTQFELQKLVDSYRSHIVQTITVPSESLLNELHIVEEMKRQCDEKREIYEELMKKHKEKGRLRNNKGEYFNLHQLQEANDEYEEEANLFVFRMKSLKQGQSRSLLTQASRHHAAQLCFFKRALRSLEVIEPHVRLVAEQQHIDYHFSALKDDHEVVEVDDDDDEDEDDGESDSDGDSDMKNGSKERDNGELSFGFGRSGPLQEVSASKTSMELDNMDRTNSPDSKMVAAGVVLQNAGRNSFSFQREARAISKSAPLFPPKKFEQAERTQLRSSGSRKFVSYVLPTPDEAKSPASRKFDNEASDTRESTTNLWHSSPLDKNNYENFGANEKLSGPIILDTHTVLKESNNIRKPSPLPPPLSEGLFLKQDDPSIASYAKKVKRQAFSGPLTDKTWTANSPNHSASGPIASSRNPPPFSGSLLGTPLPRPVSAPKLSSRVTPNFVSSPKISELHELPRPPSHLGPKRSTDRITHSGPIISKSHELSNARLVTTSAASALPMPPLTLPRSYSIPAGGPKEMALCVPLESSQNVKIEDVSSPPLTPIDYPRM
ncbi:hypothetical protein F511_37607 [Dorcoceras hygrometricum]|uniref:Hydroxyproline-rich glycoprotein family protein n=1 Tax=Dorcoceras hygrometricum TaxID=472368 RepID=A0A2Z7D3L5_9LAMI|nr:hypothetical protein F511_37607 [Dorcoceras hygrometricum]